MVQILLALLLRVNYCEEGAFEETVTYLYNDWTSLSPSSLQTPHLYPVMVEGLWLISPLYSMKPSPTLHHTQLYRLQIQCREQHDHSLLSKATLEIVCTP